MNDQSGPAFPFAGETGHSLNDPGMTLRDYFAAKALPHALELCSTDSEVGESGPVTNAAAYAYEIADAMLAAREDK